MKSVPGKAGTSQKPRRAGQFLIGFVLVLLMLTAPLRAQETGPLLMKQELGYTLGGGIVGTGFGVVLWFMDPLGPIDLKDYVKDGFVSGVILGSLFGFYLLQNAAQFPIPGGPLPELPLGFERKANSENLAYRAIQVPVFSIKF